MEKNQILEKLASIIMDKIETRLLSNREITDLSRSNLA